jgi:cysteine-rich repeat protein
MARDKCATAPPLTLSANPDGTYGTSVVSGTTGLVHDITLSTCTSQGPDAFFAVTAPVSGVLTATVTSATFRTSLGGRSACPSAGTQLACDATQSDGGQEISFSVTQGNKYYLIVDGQNVSGRLNYGRFTMDVKVTPTGCGDTFVSPPEQCDDGNLADGDGCSSTCTVETLAGANACPGHAVTLTGTGSEVRRATVTVDTTSLPSKTGSICGGSGPEGILVVTPDIDGQILIRSTGLAERALYARTTCGDPATEVSKKDCSATNLRSVSGPVQKNTPYYVFVDGLNGTAGTTTLQITVTP